MHIRSQLKRIFFGIFLSNIFVMTSSKNAALKFRSESDSLGKVEVPADAFWGAQTARALANFPISSQKADPALIRAYLRIKWAAALANESSGALTRKKSKLIAEVIEEILGTPEESWSEYFPVDVYQAGAGTSFNMNVNEVIANLANQKAGGTLGKYWPIHPNDDVNHSQSTNDTFPTAMRLALLEVSDELLMALNGLSDALDSKGKEWISIPKSARTHLQDAVPMRLGEEFRAYALTVRKCAKTLSETKAALRELPIGGSAAGTSLNVPAHYIASIIQSLRTLTGEPVQAAPNRYEAMESQFPVGLYSSVLRLMALELTRICNDLRLLSSGPMTGFAELILPSAQPGSSIMPGKVNPSIVEMANQAWFAVIGYDQTVALALQAGQLELNVMMPVMAHASILASRIAAHAARALDEKCIRGIEPNRARLQKYFESTPQVATALAPKLGYERTAKLVQEALEQGKSVIELAREKDWISEEDVKSLLNVRRLTGG